MNICEEIEVIYPQLLQIRRDFHQHPELGAAEHRTGQQICRYLDRFGISYDYPVADTGIVACINGKKEGCGTVVALRADMDALPLTEPGSHPYHSQTPGIMHACGHDAHMTIQLGTALLLKQFEKHWFGQVKFFFQPAEETIGGAKRMMEAGCMKAPSPNYVIGLHVKPELTTGHIEVKYGKLNAASDTIEIQIVGKSCHGAYPDQGIDAIVTAAHLVTSLQTLTSRRISPLDQAALTFGTIAGGTAHNIVSDRVVLTGTLRTTSPETRKMAIQAIRLQTAHISAAHGAVSEISIVPGYAPLLNTDSLVDLLVETAAPLLGKEQIHWKELPSLGVEDFSFFLEQTPGVFYHLGCKSKEEQQSAPLHSPDFNLDESCLKTGVLLQWSLTQALLKQ